LTRVLGSSTTALYLSRLATLFGLHVILIIDLGKHGKRLSTRGTDILVDSQDPERAVTILRAITGEKLRYAIDCVGKETAGWLLESLGSTDGGDLDRSHLIGMSGFAKTRKEGVVLHQVPIKLYHEIPQVGEAIMTWLGSLLAGNNIPTPDITVIEGGLASINDGLDRMRRGEISGRRLVVNLSTHEQ
jgi:threonine dehydrogenase-like Zn-dependent dehydrogenase